MGDCPFVRRGESAARSYRPGCLTTGVRTVGTRRDRGEGGGRRGEDGPKPKMEAVDRVGERWKSPARTSVIVEAIVLTVMERGKERKERTRRLCTRQARLAHFARSRPNHSETPSLLHEWSRTLHTDPEVISHGTCTKIEQSAFQSPHNPPVNSSRFDIASLLKDHHKSTCRPLLEFCSASLIFASDLGLGP